MKWNRHARIKAFTRLCNPIGGLSLIESLVAIAVIGIAAASVGPVILISAATRVQSQRAEQALQLAQGEIDRVRQILEQKVVSDGVGGARDYTAADLEIASTPGTVTGTPTNALWPTAALPAFNNGNYRVARSVDVNSDGDADFAIQSFRFGETERSIVSTPGTTPIPTNFLMGVRVYEVDAVDGAALDTTAARLNTTAGEGERNEKPLAVLYTEINRSDERQSLCEYFEYRGSTTSSISTLDCS